MREVPDGACDGVAACPHLVVDLDRRQLPADPVVGAAHGEPGLRQGALVSGHTGRRLFREKKNKRRDLLLKKKKKHNKSGALFGFTTEM